MTRTAWFHCFSGVSGDMTLGALLDAGADPVAVGRIISGLGIPGWSLGAEPVMRQGLRATRAIVHAPDEEHHRHYAEIRRRLSDWPLPERVRSRSLAVFAALAEAEAALHGVPVDEVEFHEVGSLDAIVDVVGVCAALEVLGIDEIVCSPISVGRGEFPAAHGILPNPAPAVVRLAATHAVPLAGLDEPSELATPTGVALMAALATGFGPMPTGTVLAAGMGAGGRNPQHRPNVVQVVLLDTEVDGAVGSTAERLIELTTNVDDVTGEVLAFTIEELLRAGALDAWVRPITMKKGRPAHTVHVLCRAVDVPALRTVLMEQTGTLGVRATSVDRWAAEREMVTVEVGGHPVRVKQSAHRTKAEYDDAAAAARALGRTLRSVQTEAERLAESQRVGPPIVSPEWLAAQLGTNLDLVVADVRWYLDGRSGRVAYDSGHIEGAVFVDLDAHLCDHGQPATAGRHPLPSPHAFARAMSALGIGDTAHVVAYDDAGGSTAARLVVMLRSLGVRASVLDGGLASWQQPLQVGPGTPVVPATFTERPWPASRIVDIDHAAQVAAGTVPGSVLLDARAPERYRGETEPIDPRAGHIPGALNAPWAANLDPTSGRFRSPDELRRHYASLGIDAGTDVVCSCGSGVTACHDILALEHAGLRTPRLFVASWSGWCNDPARPVASVETR